MRIRATVVSDFICPWCYIGKRRLLAAVDSLPAGIAVQIHWRPFELNPDMPPEGIDRRTYRTRKFGSWERSLKLDAQVVEAARNDAIAFNYDRVARTPNTRAAHRLVWLAQHAGDATPLVEAIFRAYFTDGLDIGRPEVLTQTAGAIGYEADQVAAYLATADGSGAVRDLEAQAAAGGIDGVPFVLIERETLVGAHAVSVYREILDRAAEQVSDAAD